MNIKLLTEHHLVFLSLKGGCTYSSESSHVKMPHCSKSHVTAHFTVGFCFIKCFLLIFGMIICVSSCEEKMYVSHHSIKSVTK